MINEIRKKRLFDRDEMYLPLILAINQYVSDEEERKKLIRVITMDMPADEIYEKVMSSGILEKGIEQGIEQGIGMALRFSRIFGVEEASKVSGFSVEELESGELLNK